MISLISVPQVLFQWASSRSFHFRLRSLRGFFLPGEGRGEGPCPTPDAGGGYGGLGALPSGARRAAFFGPLGIASGTRWAPRFSFHFCSPKGLPEQESCPVLTGALCQALLIFPSRNKRRMAPSNCGERMP
jgi:hypothetical protein